MGGSMRFAGKEFAYYWMAIRWPTLILVMWSIVGMAVAITAFDTYITVFNNRYVGMASYLLFLIAGYLAASDYGADAKQSAWAGALCAVIFSTVGLIVTIILLSSTPLLEWTAQQSIAQAVAKGAEAPDAQTMGNILKIVIPILSLIGIALNGLLGALLGWIGSLVAKKV